MSRGTSLRLAVLLLAFALVASPARADDHSEHAIGLQLTAGVIGGVLASGYGLLLADRLSFRGDDAFTLSPLPFAAGAVAAVWLTGRWSGLRSGIAGTVLGALVPALAGMAVLALAGNRDAPGFVAFASTPVLTLGGAVLGFELAREPSDASADRSP